MIESEWWFGPKWLYQQQFNWPVSNLELNEKDGKGEINWLLVTQIINLEKVESCFINNFSSYTVLDRFIARVFMVLLIIAGQKFILKEKQAMRKW